MDFWFRGYRSASLSLDPGSPMRFRFRRSLVAFAIHPLGTLLSTVQRLCCYFGARLTGLFCSLGNEMGIDPNIILATSHGRRSIDVLKLYDPARANWKCMFHVDIHLSHNPFFADFA